MFLYNISTDHIGILEFHSFSNYYSEFFLFGGYDEKESIIQIFLSDPIFIENLEYDIQEFISFSVWDE